MFEMIRRVFKIAGNSRGKIVAGIVCNILKSFFNGFMMFGVFWVLLHLDNLTPTIIGQAFCVILGSVLGCFFFQWMYDRTMSGSGYDIFRDYRLEIGDRLKQAPMGYFSEQNLGTIQAMLTTTIADLEGYSIPANLPYGYTLQDHSIRIVEEQAVIVQRIFKEYLSGKSTERIASDLREEGIPCKSGEVAWDSTAIRYIISNEKYIGDSVWQKYFSTDTLPYKCRLNRGQKVSYYAYGTHEGIVPKEDFEKANALMKSRAQKITLTKNSPYAFRKKIVCGDCQSLFRRKVVRGITYWVCIGHDKKRHGLKCGITPIAEDEITNAFIRLYYKLKHHGEPILMGMTTSLQAIRNRRMLWSLDVIELNKQISDLTSQNQMLATLKQQGLIDPDIFIAQSNELTEQLRAVKLKKERLLAVDGDNTISQTRELMEILDDGPDFLDSFDAELFGELVETIIVESNERIRFRLKNGLELSETIERTVR